jgi:hypothetical protein
MGLNISFKLKQKVTHWRSGDLIKYIDVDCVESEGRVWYPFLEEIGYYIPHELLTEENNWYGKDMTLSTEQIMNAWKFVTSNPIYQRNIIRSLLAEAIVNDDLTVAINADW